MASRNSQQETVSLDSLSAQQLTAVKKQLDEEVEHLSGSYQQLAVAQAKFKECLHVVSTAGPTSLDDILVPLTNSLYVKGKLSEPDRVIVDVGTGFFVEKDTKSAAEFYEGKVKELGANIQELEAIIQNKSNSLRIVEEVLRQKVLAAGAGPGAGQAQAA
ncbi:putative prefoldin subunit 5 [Lasiosphaeria hispida]|uniref:Prefoldin subunit 5 n=1 Tax=Lasiosphaeria hispida TaxID=260671 RepID=A0AAJ0MJQ0_9PEZI|nr:putative prefoldin subunit 5 [Lasiosphaeria hispida]